MFESYVKNDLPYIRSPFETDREAFQNLFHRALQTQHRLNFTLEELSCTPELTAEITPLFEVTFGHFGFKIRGLTPEAIRRVNWIWEPHGKLIDFAAFHDGLSEFHGMWMINHLSFTPIGEHRWRSIPEYYEPPVCDEGGEDWSNLLTLRHRFGHPETVPYQRDNDNHLLGRWYQTSGQGDWRLEWLSIDADKIIQQSRSEWRRDLHTPVFPLVEEDELISDFLGATDVYIPPNFVPSLTKNEKLKQLGEALWWMECRFRFVPRFPKWRLRQLLEDTTVDQDCFQLPMIETPLTTTEILQLYSHRGNDILRWLTTRPEPSTGGEHE